MASKFEALRGMEDILPGEIEKWQWVESKARLFFESRGFKEIRTPVLEYTDLFTRSVGESSDIVHKEMFSFEDRGGRNITLRPEMTASVARSVIEKGLLKTTKSLRFYYIGPMFRAERPQAGRKRQFHQIGAELINESGADADFENLELIHGLLRFLGIENPLFRINDLGDAAAREGMVAGLKKYFASVQDKLCKDCQWRLEKNVLRIFDCKVEACQPVIQQAPWDEFAPLSEAFVAFTGRLKNAGIAFEIKRRLVRGLDYYTGIVFEATAPGLGAQDALAGGGRYDGLYQELGGNPAPCTGFSIGFERLLSVLDYGEGALSQKLQQSRIYLAPLDAAPEVMRTVRDTALKLRSLGWKTEITPGEYSLSKHLKKANQFGIRFVLMLGLNEVQNQQLGLKDMQAKTQQPMTWEELADHLKGVLPL